MNFGVLNLHLSLAGQQEPRETRRAESRPGFRVDTYLNKEWNVGKVRCLGWIVRAGWGWEQSQQNEMSKEGGFEGSGLSEVLEKSGNDGGSISQGCPHSTPNLA